MRGFSLGVAGLVLATNVIVGLGAGPLAGVVVDRFGARVTLATSLVLMAASRRAWARSRSSAASPATCD